MEKCLFFFNLVCEATGAAATPGLLCQPRVIVKIIVEKHMECRLAGETEVLGENLPQRHFCPSQNPTLSDLGLDPGRRGGKPVTNSLSYGAAWQVTKRNDSGLVTGCLEESKRTVEKTTNACAGCIWQSFNTGNKMTQATNTNCVVIPEGMTS
jgi:hypothetical protein